jgi:hypothetical protein
MEEFERDANRRKRREPKALKRKKPKLRHKPTRETREK